ncbi:hypothetical protein [Deinococcus arcticus]|uniref:Hpr(Ser) kinase/phosphatase n=1 Tax=Deinococcus arcticus TaxID=2136176 RepID=A0A2T3W7X2_9DEIO|nr:hypothetical protein [Deinococcus arcticus]PTA67894.1 hypothetical protein C8263_10895 [Deinococcus arcticus]
MTGTPPPSWRSLDAAVALSGVAPAVQAALHADWHTPGEAGAEPPRRRMEITAGPGGWPPGLARQSVPLMDRVAAVAAQGNVFWLDGQLRGKVDPQEVRLQAAPGAARDAWALALTEAHRAGGWLPLHAALVAGPGGAAAVLGVSGAGKSTAALRLRAGGWTVLAEDRAWVDPHGQATGLDRTLRAYRDSVERFAPALLTEFGAAPRDPRGKALLALAPAPPAPLRAVLVLAPLGAGEVTPAERVRSLWEASGVPLTALGRVQAAQAVARLAQGPVWRRVTRDEVPGAVAALLGPPGP